MSLTDHLGPGDGLLTSEGRGSEPLPALWWADPADAAESRLLYPDALSLGDPHPLLPSSRRVLAAGGRDLTRGAPLYLAEDAAAVPSASLLLVTSERARVALEDATDASPCLVVGLDASDDVARLWRTSGPGLVLAFIDAVPARTRLLVQAFARAFPMRRDVELLVFAQDEAGCTAALADEAAIRVLPLERLQGVDGDDRFDLLVADDDSRRAMPLAEAVGRQKRLLRVSLDPADDDASIVDHVAFELREAARVFLKLGVGHDAAAAIAEDDRPSWRAKGGLLKQLVSGVVPGASTLDGIGWITRWNVPCGIGDHAAH